MLRRWRAHPELLILALAIAIAVAASSGVSLFGDRIARAFEDQSGEAFGADAALRSRDPLAADVSARLDALRFRRAQLVEFTSVALAGEQTSMASVKAVSAAYPLRGQLRTAAEPFAPERVEEKTGGPPPGEVWVDLRLWQDLALAPGASLQLGQSVLRVTRIVTYEPDRGGGFADFAPRLLLNQADLAATHLIGLGSRVTYTEQLAGDAESVAKLRAEMKLPEGVRLLTPQEGRPEIRNSVERAQRFLDIAVLAAMLLAGSAIAISSHQHGLKLRDEAALYKVLGATSAYIARRSLLRLLRLGAIASAAGLGIGAVAQALVARLAIGMLNAPLPPTHFGAAWWSLAVGLLLLLGFAAPPWLAARHTPPVHVFQRRLAPSRGRHVATLAAAGTAALLVGLHAGDPKLAAIVLGGAVGASTILALVAWLLVGALTRLRESGGTALRFGLANIARRRSASVAQAVALGVALLALLVLAVVHRELLETWRQRLPPDTPNQFLINIQPDQRDALDAFFRAHGYDGVKLWPMTRARLVALRGAPVVADSFSDPDTRRWINREFNLSWTDSFGDDNRLLAGQWWTAGDRGKPWLSIDDNSQERLGLKLGDHLTLQMADRTVELEVRNVRKVSWDSFRPNFFLVTPPGVLEDGPTQWITSFHLPPEKRAMLRELIRAFPNVTALDLDAVMQQVRSIVDRIVNAVEFIFVFTLAAGLTVLLAAIEGTRAERVRETALLRTLGARTRTIMLGLLAEYAALGLVAGLVASAAAQAVGFAVARWVFEMPFHFNPGLWAIGSLGGSALVALLGWLSLRGTLATPPRSVLMTTA